MRLPVLGATGRTGGQLLEQALEQGHEISDVVLIAWRIGGAVERRQQRENADPLASNRTLLVWLRTSLAAYLAGIDPLTGALTSR
jgi:putative NADH-flavin reductase